VRELPSGSSLSRRRRGGSAQARTRTARHTLPYVAPGSTKRLFRPRAIAGPACHLCRRPRTPGCRARILSVRSARSAPLGPRFSTTLPAEATCDRRALPLPMCGKTPRPSQPTSLRARYPSSRGGRPHPTLSAVARRIVGMAPCPTLMRPASATPPNGAGFDNMSHKHDPASYLRGHLLVRIRRPGLGSRRRHFPLSSANDSHCVSSRWKLADGLLRKNTFLSPALFFISVLLDSETEPPPRLLR